MNENDDKNPQNEFVLMGHVDTIDNESLIFKGVVEHSFHELYLRGFYQSKSFFHHHFPPFHQSKSFFHFYFPQTKYRQSVDLPNDLKKQIQKLRRKMKIPLALGKLKHQISRDINFLNKTPGKTNWQPDYYDVLICNFRIFKAYKKYIETNSQKWASDNFFQ